MSEVNNHITAYLDYYLELQNPPEFAILLRGNWGCGKSWFLKDYRLKKETEGYKFLNVSLYGISSSKGIDDALFEQLHPLLSSKGMKLAGKIIKGFVKTAINIDFNKDGKSDASISSTMPDVELPEYLKNTDSRIIIFDDLERCSMKTEEVLGYINQFVENKGLKVIIAANEDEIVARESKVDKKDAYLLIKEKLIGKTFEVRADFEFAFKSFVASLSNPKLQEFLTSKKELINDVYKEASYSNLRHLRQSLLDFERFFSLIPEKVFLKPELVDHIIQFFFSISFELKKGAISFEDIKLTTSYSSLLNDGEDSKNTPVGKVRSKYSVFSLYHNPIKETLWYDFFKTGSVDVKELEKSLFNSIYYRNEIIPAWNKLWNYFNLTDEEFQVLCLEVFDELKSLKITEKGIVIHITTMLLHFISLGLFKKDKKNVLALGKKNIDSLKSKNNLATAAESRFNHFDIELESYQGLGFHGLDSPETKEFIAYVKDAIITSGLQQYPEQGEKLLDLMKTDATKFGDLISITSRGESIYYNIPIFQHIKVRDFVNTFMELTITQKREVGYHLKQRYIHPDFRKPLIKELDWLKKVKDEIEKQSKKFKGQLTGYILTKSTLAQLDESIKFLEA